MPGVTAGETPAATTRRFLLQNPISLFGAFGPNCPMPAVEPLLKLINISKRFDSPDGASPITILEGISLEIGGAESLAIIGPSGSGKSTLLHIIGTLDRPSAGAVTLAGRDLNAL